MASVDIKPDVKATRHKRTGSCLGLLSGSCLR